MCLGLCPGWGTQLNEGTQPGRGNPRIWNWISGVCDTGFLHLCPSLAGTGEDGGSQPGGVGGNSSKGSMSSAIIDLLRWLLRLGPQAAKDQVGRQITTFADKAAARQAFEGDMQVAANRFFRDATSKSMDFQVQDLGNGQYRMQFFSPADNPGYGKLYVQDIDSSGTVLQEYTDTLGPDGLMRRSWIHGGSS